MSPDTISPATQGLLIVAGVSALVLLGSLCVVVVKVALRVLAALSPKPEHKGKAKARSGRAGAAQNGEAAGAGAGAGAGGAGAGAKERGPDLKSLIKEQQRASSKKAAVKDDQASQHALFLNTLKGHGDVVHSVAWNAEGTQLLTACEDMYVRLWELTDVTSKEPKFRRIKAAKTPLGAVWGDAPASAVVFMKGIPDAQLAGYAPSASNDAAGAAYEQQWLAASVHGKEPPLALRGAVAGASLARRSIAVSCSQRKDVRVYNAQGRELAMLEPNSLTNHGLAVSWDGRFVAVASFTAEVKIWEVRWDKTTGEFKGAVKAMELKGHKSQVLAVAFSPDSKRAVTASKDGTLRVWNIDVRYHLEEDPKTLLVVPQPLASNRLYQHLAYGPNGIIAGSWEGMVHLLSASTGEILDTIDAHDAAITSMQWCSRLVKTPGAAAPHPVLATSSRDRRVRLWRAE